VLLPEQTSPQHPTAEGTLGLLWARTGTAHQHPNDDEYKVYSAYVLNLENETSQMFSCTVTRTFNLWNLINKIRIKLTLKASRLGGNNIV